MPPSRRFRKFKAIEPHPVKIQVVVTAVARTVDFRVSLSGHFSYDRRQLCGLA
jgi:hypothetical protein